jgi:DNA-binding NarL/FixJ family response regulator
LVSPIVLITSDLACASSVAGAAARVGAELRTALGAAAVDEKLAGAPPALVIVDLSMRDIRPAQLVPALRARLPENTQILAFGSHVHTALLAAAREAGCDRVISRGEFHARMDEYLRQPT